MCVCLCVCVSGLTSSGVLSTDLDTPVLPADIVAEAVPGNIRKARHFVMFMTTVLQYLKTRLRGNAVVQETPVQFIRGLLFFVCVFGIAKQIMIIMMIVWLGLEAQTGLQPQQLRALRFSHDRLMSLLRTLQISNVDEFTPLQLCADFATLVSTYVEQGFTVLMEPYNDRTPEIKDPVLRLACLDASIAMKPVLNRYTSINER